MMIKRNIHLFRHNSEENVGNHDNETTLYMKKPTALNFASKLTCACDIVLCDNYLDTRGRINVTQGSIGPASGYSPLSVAVYSFAVYS